MSLCIAPKQWFLLCCLLIAQTNNAFAQSGGTNLADTTSLVAQAFDQRPWLFNLACKSPQGQAKQSIQPELMATLQPKIDKNQIWNFERKSRIKHYNRQAPLSGRPTNKSPIAFVVQLTVKILNNFIHPNQKQALFNGPKIKLWGAKN
jgi:hypothetical protein